MLPSMSSILSLESAMVFTLSRKLSGIPIYALMGLGAASLVISAVPSNKVIVPISLAACAGRGKTIPIKKTTNPHIKYLLLVIEYPLMKLKIKFFSQVVGESGQGFEGSRVRVFVFQ